jgi:hypothetical protein
MVLIIPPEILVRQLIKQTPKHQVGARNLRALSNSTQTPKKKKKKRKTRTKVVGNTKRTTNRTAKGTGRRPQINLWTIK